MSGDEVRAAAISADPLVRVLLCHIAALEADNAALLHEADGQCGACAGEGVVPVGEGPKVGQIVHAPCPLHEARRAHPGAALLEEHRKALARARNEGLEKAARLVHEMTASKQRIAEHLRAMKELES